MPTLTIKGQKPGPPPIDYAVEIGSALIAVVEAARAVGELKERTHKMADWLRVNEQHPKYRQRDTGYWLTIQERNQAMRTETRAIEALGACISNAGKDACTEVSDVVGRAIWPGMGPSLASIAELDRSGTWLCCIDEWSKRKDEAFR